MIAPVARIQRAVAEHYRLPRRVILARDMSPSAVRARQIGMFLARTMLGKGPTEIGRRFNRDHSTVMSNIRRVENNPQMIEEAAELAATESDDHVLEEMSDLEELVDAWLALRGLTRAQLEIVQAAKREKRGGFADRILMLEGVTRDEA